MSETVEDDGSATRDVNAKDFYYYEGGKWLASPAPGDEMVVTGIIDDESKSTVPRVYLPPQINNKFEVPKVLLFPGIEGFAKMFTTHIDGAVALQYVVDGQTTSVVKIIESLLTTVENLLIKEQPFTIVAYSYGTVIALEIVNILESQGYSGTVICIDGAPLLMNKLVKNLYLSESYLQTSLICETLSHQMPSDTVMENKENIENCNTWQEKMDYGLEALEKYDIKDAGYLIRFIDTIYMRLKYLYTYTPTYTNLKSNIKLFKPVEATVKDIEDDYGLSHFFEKPVEIHYFDGNHETIIKNAKVADSVNLIVQQLK